MKRLALVVFGALALTGCVSQSFPSADRPRDPTPAAVGVFSPEGKAYQEVRFGAGLSDVELYRLAVSGGTIRVNDARCRAEAPGIVCRFEPGLPVPAGKNFVLPITGTNLSAVAVYKRGGVEYTIP